MKKLSILFVSVLALGLSFTSCSKDDDNNSTSTSVEGKWNYSKISVDFPGVPAVDQDYPSQNPTCGKDFVEFKANGVANFGYYSSDCKVVTDPSTWKQDGNKLTVDGDTSEIISNTGSVLKLKSTETEGGVTVSSVITLVKG